MELSETISNAGQSADEIISTRVVMAVAETLGVDPLDVEQLNGVVDPDALNRLAGQAHSRDGFGMRIEFELSGCTVAVDGTGTIDVTPPDGGEVESDPGAVAGSVTESPPSIE